MKFTHPEIETLFDTGNGCYNTLVIENQRFLLRLLEDISGQIRGLNGASVISRGGRIVPASKNAELLDCFVPFEINRKTLLTRLCAALERHAVSPEMFERTSGLLTGLENYLSSLAFDSLSDIEFTTVSVPALIKACSPRIRAEQEPLAEQILDYMQLVTEYDAPKLFFTLNLRAFIGDEDMEHFAAAAISHGYDTIGIESAEHPRLSMEKRIVIDEDLCEIG